MEGRPPRLSHTTIAEVMMPHMANGLGNVPTTTAAAQSPDLKIMTPQFKTFVDVWNNPKSGNSPPITASAPAFSAARATRVMSVTFGVSLTMTGVFAASLAHVVIISV